MDKRDNSSGEKGWDPTRPDNRRRVESRWSPRRIDSSDYDGISRGRLLTQLVRTSEKKGSGGTCALSCIAGSIWTRVIDSNKTRGPSSSVLGTWKVRPASQTRFRLGFG